MHARSLETDPKHITFMLARYLFVSRMLEGADSALEVGCGDGTGSRIVRQVVQTLVGLDLIPPLEYPGTFICGDIRRAPVAIAGDFDAVFALDVLEHIRPDDERAALRNMAKTLKPNGICIIGMPSLESQAYASELSRRHHINCKTEAGLRETMAEFFHRVFMFGMNDCTLHCGYGPMTHYRLALCTGKRP
jgi:SAM-dependent methyltransferase